MSLQKGNNRIQDNQSTSKFLQNKSLNSSSSNNPQFKERSYSKDSRDGILNLNNLLNDLAKTIANAIECFTVNIFIKEGARSLRSRGYHTLSREFTPDIIIPFGSGLVGWTAEHELKISVCPFEHDSTTLRYYNKDQELKSFLSIPIKDDNGELLGVLACDSKKSYAFSKLAEKILTDCAGQVKTILKLFSLAVVNTKDSPDAIIEKEIYLEQISQALSEDQLVELAFRIPTKLVSRGALVVHETFLDSKINLHYDQEAALGDGEPLYQKLLDLTAKHKRIKSVKPYQQGANQEDLTKRTYLSVPINFIDKEVGSINLLSREDASFLSNEIKNVELVADQISRTLEKIALRKQNDSNSIESISSRWSRFVKDSDVLFQESFASSEPLSFVRIILENRYEIEAKLGIEAAAQSYAHLERILSQLKKEDTLLARINPNEILLLTGQKEGEILLVRLEKTLDRAMRGDDASGAQKINPEHAKLILSGITAASVSYPKEGKNINELLAASRNLILGVDGSKDQKNQSQDRSTSVSSKNKNVANYR